MTDDEMDALRFEIAADLEDVASRQEAVMVKLRRLNAALAERGREPATVHELHPR